MKISRILGLVGGIGSGKSSAARLFAESGAVVLDADKIGHEILLQSDVKQIACDRWGDTIFDSNGEIQRRKLAKIVFEPSEQGQKELEFLNKLTHPRITETIRDRIETLKSQGTPLILVDAPLLFESGWNRLVSEVIFVDAPESLRLKRVLSRGWTPEEFRKREATQWSVEKKRSLADHVLLNTGTWQQLQEQVLRFLDFKS